MSTNNKNNKKKTKQVRIGSSWHKLLKVTAAENGETIRCFLESILSESDHFMDNEIKIKDERFE